MEQRIDPKIQPEFAVGTDPAYIPGLTAPRPGASDTATEEKTDPAVEPEPGGTVLDDAVPEGAGRPDGFDAEAEPEEEAEPEKPETAEAETADTADGPVFEVSDRRGSIAADHEGVRFRLDEEEADFRWDEIGAVEITTPRFARRFTVTVHVSDRRWFTAEVEAPARSSLKEWTADLDKVLDTYFEES
ncbi:hypothetical protein ACFY7Z_10060 [Streptomyces sp. NPDC012623]|uniref:hypothetical protein n=1 Tax=unclassified Streptomyces TaxID=2593676 RepID=UPI0036B7F532